MPKPVAVGAARAALALPPLAGGRCSASRSSSSTVTFSVFRWLLRKIVTGTVVPGLVLTTIATSASLSLTGLPLNSTIDVAGLMPALAAGPFGLTVEISAPLVFGRPKRLRGFLA